MQATARLRPRVFASLCVSIALATAGAHAHEAELSMRTYQHAGWNVIETENFRVYHGLADERARRWARFCESTRRQLRATWLGTEEAGTWTPKCDVFLYSTPQHFRRGTGQPADRMGYASLNVGHGRVTTRRLHVRADDTSITERVLPHELTHVVLADKFSYSRIPRWADEGVAVTSEPAAQRNELREEAQQALRRNRLFSVSYLVQLRDYPSDPSSADLFYAQSAAFVEFLSERTSPTETIRFVETCSRSGIDRAARDVLKLNGVSRLEAEWRKWLHAASTDATPLQTTETRAGGDLPPRG